MDRIGFNLKLALEAVAANTLRAALTALGIVFGVGAVIAMLAIGTGAKESIVAQMRLIGTNNILVEAVMPADRADGGGGQGFSDSGNGQERGVPWSPGLTLADVAAVEQTLPTVAATSPELAFPVPIIYDGRLERGRVVGVGERFADLNNLSLAAGRDFHYAERAAGRPVCVVGADLARVLFPDGEPTGRLIKCGRAWLRVIGVLEGRGAADEGEGARALGIRDRDEDVYVPVQTALSYLGDRGRVTPQQIADGRGGDDEADARPPDNPHQIDRFVVQVTDTRDLQATADVVARLLERRHRGVEDFAITVPRLLLEQQQRTQDTFNLVLATIAGISLLVGGIGIMNIMLASVLERTREVGIRRSLGATERDITQQFLGEAALISLFGGLLGVGLGIGGAELIAAYAEVETVVTAWSVALAFGVAATVGLVFGLLPAERAASLDPVEALRT